MVKKVRVKMNSSGARALMNSSGVQADLASRAATIGSSAASSSGGWYESSVQSGKNRARASVITADVKAIRDNARNNTLLKSLGSGR